MTLLNITIPTFNRAKQLERCLSSIFNSININLILPFVHITVVDNNSDYRIEDLIASFKIIYPKNITLFRNEVNVGMANNFIKCFEHSVGKYTWIFSDDEFINKKSLYFIINELLTNDYDVIFLNNSRIKKNKKDPSIDFVKLEIKHFIKKVSVFNTLITKNIFRTKHIDLQKSHQNTLFPFLIAFYESINKVTPKPLYIDGDIFSVTFGDASGYNWFNTFINDLTNIHNLFPQVIIHSYKRKLYNDLIKYFLFKQFLIVGLKMDRIKRNTLEKFEKYDFNSIFKLIKLKFKNFISFYIFILPIYLLPIPLRRLLYYLLIEFYQPYYRKKD